MRRLYSLSRTGRHSPVDPRDLDDGDAMRCHFDIDELRRHVGKADQILTPDPREHDLFVGIFVIDAEQCRDRCSLRSE